MKKEHYAELTIKNTGRRLRYLAKFCDLDNPEQIEAFLANMKTKTATLKQSQTPITDTPEYMV